MLLLTKSLITASFIGVVAIPVSTLSGTVHSKRYEVTITNLTRGQIMSPAVVATHNSRLTPIFELGKKASPELAALAEDAVNPPLMSKLSMSKFVRSVKEIKGAAGPIMPGETAIVVIDTGWRYFDRLSLASMLVSTNDAFMALNGVKLPRSGSVTILAIAYDAGSEGNNEKCTHIPGPPCGKLGVRDTANAEGYVHVHAGIHGIGDLDPAKHDWRNPVAKIVIRAVRR